MSPDPLLRESENLKFEGHAGRECGEHRTLGGRAWCYECSTYCYPSAPCPGCELPALRAERDRYRQALTFIAVGEIPGQYLGDFLADRMSVYAKDVLDGKGQLEEFPGA